jgi:hypothetical protein
MAIQAKADRKSQEAAGDDEGLDRRRISHDARILNGK